MYALKYFISHDCFFKDSERPSKFTVDSSRSRCRVVVSQNRKTVPIFFCVLKFWYKKCVENLVTLSPITSLIQVFGLHSNADISYQINTAKSILDQILAVQPKVSGTTSKGETREAVVAKIAEDMLRKLPR